MTNPPGTFKWVIQQTVGTSLSLLIYGLVVGALSAPAFVFLSWGYPDAIPFAWLVLTVSVIGVIGHAQDNNLDPDIIDRIQELDKVERLQYLLNLVFLTVFMISAQVSAIAILSAGVAISLGYPVAGIIFAAIYPSIDAYLGRNYNMSFAVLGYTTARWMLTVLSIVSGTSPDVADAAAVDAKTVF
ncbi:hypothetical protein [Halopiger xanaduensis]|uniref:hypothetical protein n=1 Tax=Halopiger xanaduensis TaxID=387343 RepID=UPI0011D211E3|nr:hypothetical protein [Halopiger xanaduensis]